jgi:hypothetical protein
MGNFMKILRIIADSDPRSGGPIEGTRRFGAVWAKHGHRQDLLTLDAPGERFLTDYPGEIIAVGPPRSSNPLHKYRYAPRMIRRAVRSLEAKLHITFSHTACLILGFAALIQSST